MPLIEVKPVGNKWGVYIDGELFGTQKGSFDCDFAAHALMKIIEDGEINLHPELRELFHG